MKKRGLILKKEELIQIHTLMAQLKEYLIRKGKGGFSKYESLNISPIHVHRPRYDHKIAIFTLGEEILFSMFEGEMTNEEKFVMFDDERKNEENL